MLIRLALVPWLLFTVTLAMGCEGNPDEQSSLDDSSEDAEDLVSDALANMAGLESYAMEMAFSPEGEAIPVLAHFEDEAYFERIPAEPAGDDGVLELVQASGYLFTRGCLDPPDDCEAWVRTADPWKPIVPSMGGLTTFFPETLGAIAVELARGWHTVESNGEVILQGELMLKDAIQENQRRVARASGFSDEEIERGIKEQENASPGIEQATNIQVTIDNKSELITRVLILEPGAEDNPYFDVSYSRHNDVTVDPPEQFTVEPPVE